MWLLEKCNAQCEGKVQNQSTLNVEQLDVEGFTDWIQIINALKTAYLNKQ